MNGDGARSCLHINPFSPGLVHSYLLCSCCMPGWGTRASKKDKIPGNGEKKMYSKQHNINIVVQSPSHVQLCDPVDCSTPGFLVLHYLPEFAQIMCTELVIPSNHLILCHPLLLLPSVFPTIRVFPNKSTVHIRWPKIGASASALVLPMTIQGRFPLGLTGLLSMST